MSKIENLSAIDKYDTLHAFCEILMCKSYNFQSVVVCDTLCLFYDRTHYF